MLTGLHRAAVLVARSKSATTSQSLSRSTSSFPRRRFFSTNADTTVKSGPVGSPPAPPSIVLRNYQRECLDTCLSLFRHKEMRQAISLPVGSGKTVVFAHLIKELPAPTPQATRTLVLAHREELLQQARAKIQQINPTLRVSVLASKVKPDVNADVIVASVASLGRQGSARLPSLDPATFKCIIIDEAHHAVSPTYVRILQHFNVYGFKPSGSHIALWGCSATLQRHDGVALGNVFKTISYTRNITDMWADGFLCRPRSVVIRTHVDLSLVSVRSEDYSLEQLARTVNTPQRNQIVVQAWKEWADRVEGEGDGVESRGEGEGKGGIDDGGEREEEEVGGAVTVTEATKRAPSLTPSTTPTTPAPSPTTGFTPRVRKSTLVFAVNVAHAHDLAAAFVANGVDARVVHGGTSAEDRTCLVESFRRGQFPVLVNCEVFTEGTDIPCIDCVVLARPTRSGGLFQQMVGRGLRLWPGKQDCLLIDVVDNMGKNAMMTVPSLLGLQHDFDCKGKDVIKVKEEYDAARAAREAAEKVRVAAARSKALEQSTASYAIDPDAELLAADSKYFKKLTDMPFTEYRDTFYLRLDRELLAIRKHDKDGHYYGCIAKDGPLEFLPLRAPSLRVAFSAALTYLTEARPGDYMKLRAKKASLYSMQPITPAQATLLSKFMPNVDTSGYSRGAASRRIADILTHQAARRVHSSLVASMKSAPAVIASIANNLITSRDLSSAAATATNAQSAPTPAPATASQSMIADRLTSPTATANTATATTSASLSSATAPTPRPIPAAPTPAMNTAPMAEESRSPIRLTPHPTAAPTTPTPAPTLPSPAKTPSDKAVQSPMRLPFPLVSRGT
eukprot:m.70538 g.70538  ORF g.70538 m.70538 type:complete len:848 (-) comp12894_c0_seq1:20-2563(-)